MTRARDDGVHTVTGRRWEGDERGEGIGDAAGFAPAAAELVGAMRRPHWVTEEPAVHLLPHLERACASLPLRIASTSENEDGSFAIELQWTGASSGNGPVRAAVFGLVGGFAEMSTYVRQRSDGPEETLSFDVVTGFLEGEGRFDPHGHTLRIVVSR